MAWQLPCLQDEAITDVTAMTQMLSVINSAITRYNTWRTSQAPLTVPTLTTITGFDADTPHNQAQPTSLYPKIEYALGVMLSYGLSDLSDFVDTGTVADSEYCINMADHRYEIYDSGGAEYSWPDLVTDANAILAGESLSSAFNFTDTPNASQYKIPFTGGAWAVDSELSNIRLNQYWACTVLCQNLTYWGYQHTNNTSGVIDPEDINEAGLNSSCADSKSDLETAWGLASWDTPVTSDVPHVYVDYVHSATSWAAERMRGKFRLGSLPTGTGTSVTYLILPSSETSLGSYDLYTEDESLTEHTFYDSTTYNNNASATRTTGTYGDFSDSPSDPLTCTGSDQSLGTWYNCLWLIEDFIPDPS